MNTELKPCPCCGPDGKPSMLHRHDEDGCYWSYIECHKCGLRTRGQWVSSRSEACPLHYESVREEWNRRAAQPVSAGLTGWMQLQSVLKTLSDWHREEASMIPQTRDEHQADINAIRHVMSDIDYYQGRRRFPLESHVASQPVADTADARDAALADLRQGQVVTLTMTEAER